MRALDVPPLELRLDLDLPGALHAVFGADVLRRVHGADTVVPPFGADGRRAFDFHIGVASVPRALRPFFWGSRLRVSTRQELRREPYEYSVTNCVKMHFVGSELFRVQPTFQLRRDRRGGVTLRGAVRHTALLPWPLKGLAERFMAAHSERELLAYADALRDTGAVLD